MMQKSLRRKKIILLLQCKFFQEYVCDTFLSMIIRVGNVTRIQSIAMIYVGEWRDNMTARNSNRKVMLFVSPSQFPISFKEIVPAPENRNPTRVATNNPITRERFPALAKKYESNPIIDITKFLYTVSDCEMFENSRFGYSLYIVHNFSHFKLNY